MAGFGRSAPHWRQLTSGCAEAGRATPSIAPRLQRRACANHRGRPWNCEDDPPGRWSRTAAAVRPEWRVDAPAGVAADLASLAGGQLRVAQVAGFGVGREAPSHHRFGTREEEAELQVALDPVDRVAVHPGQGMDVDT